MMFSRDTQNGYPRRLGGSWVLVTQDPPGSWVPRPRGVLVPKTKLFKNNYSYPKIIGSVACPYAALGEMFQGEYFTSEVIKTYFQFYRSEKLIITTLFVLK